MSNYPGRAPQVWGGTEVPSDGGPPRDAATRHGLYRHGVTSALQRAGDDSPEHDEPDDGPDHDRPDDAPDHDEAAGGTGESALTVVIAGIANLGIAIAKLLGAVISGSAAMLSEAAHSFADTVTEILLFVALRRGNRPASPRLAHPHASMRPAITAMPTSTFSVPGATPVCNPASVNVPQATNSPAGIQMIRVTVNTSTSASASNA